MKFTTEREKKIQIDLVNKLSWIWIIVNAIVMIAGIFIYAPASFSRWVTNIIIVTSIGLASLLLNRFGYSKIAAYVLPGFMFIHITHLAYAGGGTTLPGILNFIPIILTTGFLLGRQKGIIVAVLCIATTFGIALLETNNMLPTINFVRTPIGRAIALILPVSIAAAIQYFAIEHLSESLASLQSEITKREEAEKLKDQTVYNLGERVKELKTLYEVGHILQNENVPFEKLFREITEVIPQGWQYPSITAARVCFAEKEYATINYKPSAYAQQAEMKTFKGTRVSIEIVYLQPMPMLDEGPFLKEERSLINMLVEMLKIDLERRERSAELKDYKYALDVASSVSITGVDDTFTFVNDNFCKTSKYNNQELLGQHWSIIDSGIHSPEYFAGLAMALQEGKPYRGEFCNKAKDGTLYWVDTTIIPFLDGNEKMYQLLNINHDITERKKAEDQLKKSEGLNRAMIENMTNGLVLLDSNWSFVYQSPSIERITGYSLADRKTKDVAELTHNEDIGILKECTEQVMAHPNKSVNFQVRIIHKAGHIVWLDGNMINLLNNPDIGAIMVYYSDVTESKKATEFFKHQFENSPDTILVINHRLKIEIINRNRPGGPTLDEYVGMDSIEILPEESRELARNAANKCFATGENIEIESEISMNRWMRSRFVPIRIDGKISSIMVIATDITKQREAEKQLRHSEEKNRALIENIADAIILIDEDENIIYQSSAAARISGYFSEDSIGKKSFSFIHQDEVEGFRTILQQVRNSPEEPLQAQFRIIHKKGHAIWLEGTIVNMLHNESIKGIIINYRDITERKEAEEKIKESEQLLRKITSQVPGNTYMFEIEESGYTKIIFSNRGTDSFNHSLSVNEIIEDPDKLREELFEDDKVKYNDAMKQAYQTQSAISVQYRIVVNNHTRWRWMQATPEKDKNGNMIWYGATSDITPLVDYIASIEQILFDISHVVRRPVSNMIGLTKLLVENEISETEIKEICKKMFVISEEMDKFIRELNTIYNQKRQNTKFNIDLASLIDKRSSLFD